MRRLPSALPILLALSLAPKLAAAPGDVWTVAPSGGDFTQIQPAIDAAADGDVILVDPGSYQQFHIYERSLSVVARTPDSVTIVGALRVANLVQGQRVNLLDLSGNANDDYALRFSNCAGSVRVRGGTWTGKTQGDFGLDGSGAYIDGCADVSLRGCTLKGGSGLAAGGAKPGSPGLRARESNVALHDCSLVGGSGASGTSGSQGGSGASGGSAARLEGGFLFVSNSTLVGGHGGHGGDGGDLGYGGSGGSGGHGVQLYGEPFLDLDEPAQLELMATVFQGGVAGVGGYGGFGNGTNGSSGVLYAGFGDFGVQILPGPLARLVGDPLWQAGNAETLTFRGPPGAAVYQVSSAKPQFKWLPYKQGVLLVGGLPLLQQVGVLDSTGTLTKNFVVPDPPTGVQGLALHRQAWVLPADGAPPILTQPLAVAWVAAGL